MKVHYNIFLVICFLSLITVFSYAEASLPWSTTFNYGPCSQRGAGGEVDCASVETDGINWNWGGTATSNPYTQVTGDANFPGGAGGNGLRQWKLSGADNRQSGPVRFVFPSPQKEVWLRWYHRYEKGFEWKYGLGPGTKEFYFRSGPTGNLNFKPASPYVGYGYGGKYRLSNQGSNSHTNYHGAKGWYDDYPEGVSDGSWHCYEIYMKMDTGGSNGKIRMWRNGQLIGDWDKVNFSANDPVAFQGFTQVLFPSNQKDPGLNRKYYLDIDDIAIYGQRPPNTDDHGNPFIGPISRSADNPIELPTPKNLTIKSHKETE